MGFFPSVCVHISKIHKQLCLVFLWCSFSSNLTGGKKTKNKTKEDTHSLSFLTIGNVKERKIERKKKINPPPTFFPLNATLVSHITCLQQQNWKLQYIQQFGLLTTLEQTLQVLHHILFLYLLRSVSISRKHPQFDPHFFLSLHLYDNRHFYLMGIGAGGDQTPRLLALAECCAVQTKQLALCDQERDWSVTWGCTLQDANVILTGFQNTYCQQNTKRKLSAITHKTGCLSASCLRVDWFRAWMKKERIKEDKRTSEQMLK